MLPGQFDDLGEGIGVAHCQLGECFSIQLYLATLKTPNELAISELAHPAGSANSRNPQPAKHSFPDPAISKSIDTTAHERHDCLPIQIMPAQVEPFGQSAQSLAISNDNLAASCPGHGFVLLRAF
jgi:hypothetical protein